MTQKIAETANPINRVETAQDSGGVSAQQGESVFIKRARRRRLDLRTLAGTARESARIYRDLTSGKISQVEAEIRSRVLGRHKEILASLEQSQQLAAISAQLEAIKSPALPPAAEDGQ